MTAALMKAMQIDAPHVALRPVERPVPRPGPGEVLIAVSACGVCRTDLHVLDGEIPARYPIVPGHEIVGRVLEAGAGVTGFAAGQRVGVPWLGHTCGHCPYCASGRENLCDAPQFTGATRDGGYATHVLADAHFCFALPDRFSDVEAAPLLCAGLIGWRALRLAGEGARIGLYGFGAAAHILAQVAMWQGREVFAFTKQGDTAGQDFARSLGCAWAGASTEPSPALLDAALIFARSLGCAWAGASTEPSPAQLDAALIFAPVGALVPLALKAVRKGGRVVCAGIYMSDIPAFPYRDLWEERQILSVANLTREDGTSFFAMAEQADLRTVTEVFQLSEANTALARLRSGELVGAAVLVP